MTPNKYIIPVIIIISVLLQSCNPPAQMKVLDYNSMDSINVEMEKYPG